MNNPIHILGSGSIGLLFANYFSKAHPVTLITRKDNTKQQIISYRHQQETRTFMVTCATACNTHNIQQLFLPVKSYQVEDAFLSIKEHLADNAIIILSHNGMGLTESISQHLTANQQLYFISTSMGALKEQCFSVNHTGLGISSIGAVNLAAKDKLDCMFNQLSSIVPNLQIEYKLPDLLWRKLLINIAINPLTTLHQVKNGQLIRPQFSLLILNLINETINVAKACGVELALASTLESVYSVISRTADNYSSMNRDVYYRRQTEIDAITGYVIKKGLQHNIATPFNTAIMNAIQDDKLSLS